MKVKIVIEENRISLKKGSECIAIDESEAGTYHIWATDPNGASTVAVLRFKEDRVERVS